MIGYIAPRQLGRLLVGNTRNCPLFRPAASPFKPEAVIRLPSFPTPPIDRQPWSRIWPDLLVAGLNEGSRCPSDFEELDLWRSCCPRNGYDLISVEGLGTRKVSGYPPNASNLGCVSRRSVKNIPENRLRRTVPENRRLQGTASQSGNHRHPIRPDVHLLTGC